jgi:maltose alpha-D-glucosyltransferase / alpha-amylase
MGASDSQEEQAPTFSVKENWLNVFEPPSKQAFEDFLTRTLPNRRWFGGKSRAIKATEISEVIPMGEQPSSACVLVRVEYANGDPEVYFMPLAFAAGSEAEQVEQRARRSGITRLVVDDKEGILYGAVHEVSFCTQLLEAIGKRGRLPGEVGELIGIAARGFSALHGSTFELSPTVLDVEQSNTTVLFGQRLILKLYRRLEAGLNPDVEIGRFLTEETNFDRLAAYGGHVEYRVEGAESITVGLLQGYVVNEGDAWQLAVDQVNQYFKRAAAAVSAGFEIPVAPGSLLRMEDKPIPQRFNELIGSFLETARLLGQRTAEMHLALASRTDDPQFRPEPFTLSYQSSLLQSLQDLTEYVFEKLSVQWSRLAPNTRALAERVLGHESQVMRKFAFISEKMLSAQRTRIHGDYHLGQVLWTGSDFVIVDFEGEPGRPVSARRVKSSPLKDVAGMIRSLHYATHRAMTQTEEAAAQSRGLETQAEHWLYWTASAYLRAYLKTAAAAPFLPQDPAELQGLLSIHLLEKAIYELGYELDHRPDWVTLPLWGIEWVLSGLGVQGPHPT